MKDKRVIQYEQSQKAYLVKAFNDLDMIKPLMKEDELQKIEEASGIILQKIMCLTVSYRD